MKHFFKTALLTLVLSLSLVPALPVGSAAALVDPSSKNEACKGLNVGGGGDACAENGSTLSRVVRNGIEILSIIVGVAAVIMIIIGGLRYITSGGDSAGINAAKNTIIYALVGLVVAALAQVLVRFVLHEI